MSRGILLPGTPQNTQPLRECDACHEKRDPEGGVRLNAKRWVCGGCWRLRRFK